MGKRACTLGGLATTLSSGWLDAYHGRRVLLTGHTGFKGSWLAAWLKRLGAEVTGFALPPATTPSLFVDAGIVSAVRHLEGDICDYGQVERVWQDVRPEIVFHLAAQALVRRSYQEPLLTIQTNTLGTAHVLELARQFPSTKAMVMVTSDKCYENHEWERGYHERDELGGRDLYSASKAAAEVLISSYRRSFFNGSGATAIASARAGNVIGGGDWSPDRIVPDAIRALCDDHAIQVRNPSSVRPWQHVLEPLSGYLLLGARLLSEHPAERARASQSFNFGPAIENTRNVSELITTVIDRWGSGSWIDASVKDAPHEAGLLRLDITKARTELAWSPRWDFETAVAKTVEWYRLTKQGASAWDVCCGQIDDYTAKRSE